MSNVTYYEERWSLFKIIAVQELQNASYKRDKWYLVGCLDYSFEQDYLNTDTETWRYRIAEEIEEMKKDCPEDFE